jgi:hypothetical protein
MNIAAHRVRARHYNRVLRARGLSHCQLVPEAEDLLGGNYEKNASNDDRGNTT